MVRDVEFKTVCLRFDLHRSCAFPPVDCATVVFHYEEGEFVQLVREIGNQHGVEAFPHADLASLYDYYKISYGGGIVFEILLGCGIKTIHSSTPYMELASTPTSSEKTQYSVDT